MTLSIGIVGTGWFANEHAQRLARFDDVSVRAFCGTSWEKAERIAGRYSGARGYGSLVRMLDDNRLDAVYLCVPPYAHGELEFELVERGIPFLIEKPLGADLEIPTRVLQAVEAKGLLTSAAYHFRYMQGVQQAKALLEGRKIGMALGYWTGDMPGVSWWRRMNQSGGQFVEQTTHIVDLLRYLAGEVTEVYANYAQRVMYEKESDVSVPDVGTVAMKLASGAVANIANTCILPASHLTGLHLYTDQGVLELSHSGLKDIRADRTTEYFNRTDPYESESRAFLHAVLTGDASGILSTYADAWLTQQVTVAANRSAAEGQPVTIA
ncbi:MAG TPA: Gfo/Idh/MocA family oxidoreductase [Paenibacillus sp.]|uniref:Gfo/Idh/MocA family protein n=1 Tax=Paenibacillus sp. TaxID=58172 RepID=UPI002C402D33|nr:Gfo/Idh/MocA family oxidoreductase [Paenibacillus sp.]HUC93823.1 Gfo/Idh/MocA family oxidoreductase [Paenibacillus sp.]